MFPSLRTDLGFGLSFFATRLVYHIAMFIYSVYWGIRAPVLATYVLTISMHTMWFASWLPKYGLPLLGFKAKTNNKKKDAKSII